VHIRPSLNAKDCAPSFEHIEPQVQASNRDARLMESLLDDRQVQQKLYYAPGSEQIRGDNFPQGIT